MNIFASDPAKSDARRPGDPAPARSLTGPRPGVPAENTAPTSTWAMALANGLPVPAASLLPESAKLWPTRLQLGKAIDELIAAGDEAEVANVARACGITEDEARAAHNEYRSAETRTWWSNLSIVEAYEQDREDDRNTVRHTEKPAGDPVWCTRNHVGEIASVSGRTWGLIHERVVATMVSTDPVCPKNKTAAMVLIESTDDENGVVTPPRMTVTFTDGDEPHVPGFEGVEQFTGTTGQFRDLAAAQLYAAGLLDGTSDAPVKGTPVEAENGDVVLVHEVRADLVQGDGLARVDLSIHDGDDGALISDTVQLSLDAAERFAQQILAGVYAARQAAK